MEVGELSTKKEQIEGGDSENDERTNCLQRSDILLRSQNDIHKVFQKQQAPSYLMRREHPNEKARDQKVKPAHFVEHAGNAPCINKSINL